MAITAATPIASAQVLLNDPSGTNYTSTKLIPIMQKAYQELQLKMTRAGLTVSKEETASLTIPANTVALVDGDSLLPSNFLEPIELFERGSSSELWSPMFERAWEPTDTPDVVLRYWAFREEQIKFIGSTTIRYVKMRYRKSLPPITATTTPLEINDCSLWLASRTGAIAALVIGENPTRATALEADADAIWEDFKGLRVKGRQGMPVRRRTNRYRT